MNVNLSPRKCLGRPEIVAGLSLCLVGGMRGGDAVEGFRPLFDGRSLEGWVNVNCAPETWTVTNGMIHCDGVPTGALRTEAQYENFILELEWRHLKPGGNAGVFIWAAALPAPGQPFLRAIEVQVLDHAYGQSDWFTTHGDVFAIHGSTMKPFPPSRGMRSFPTEHRSHASPDWNHYRITCSNAIIRLAVNGKDVSGGSDCVWRKGYLGLESEGGVVDWRNLRIKVLPSSGATEEQSAPPAAGWVSLYDGRSLHGWHPPTSPGGRWTPADWTLRADGRGASNVVLWADRELGDFEFLADWSWTGEPRRPTPPLRLRVVDDASRILELPSTDPPVIKGWNRMHVVRAGAQIAVSLNGRPLVAGQMVPGKVRLGLGSDGLETRFANLFIK